jgi:hypothetical protein
MGIPSIVKARVPIASLNDNYYPDSSMIMTFLLHRGHLLENEIEHEAFSIEKIGSQNIIEVMEYPSNSFIRLTRCDEWGASYAAH